MNNDSIEKIKEAKNNLAEFRKGFFGRSQIHENEYNSPNTIEIKILTDMFDNLLSGLIEVEENERNKKN